MSFLTSDNHPLSRPTNDASECRAVNCKSGLPETVVYYVRNSLSENTRRAYLSDMVHYRCWGGSVPATPAEIASYLAEHAPEHSVATLTRRLTSIAKAHRSAGLASPTNSELVKATLRGIKRQIGAGQQEAKPLLKDELFIVLNAMGETLRDARDRALLLVGFAGAFRRSELVSLNMADIDHSRQGIIIHLRRSKTDQASIGRKVAIPHGRGPWCPVSALEQWTELAGITDGPVFRPIDRHGHLGQAKLSGESVCVILRARLQVAGIKPDGYSGHSLRAGFATSAAKARVSPWKIRQQTGHSSEAMLARYIRDGELFQDNAAGAVL